MVQQRVLIATYDSLDAAAQVRCQLLNDKYDRGDVAIAVNNDTEHAMVTVTVPVNDKSHAAKLLTSSPPLTITERNTQWRINGKSWRHLEPDADDFTAVRRAAEE